MRIYICLLGSAFVCALLGQPLVSSAEPELINQNPDWFVCKNDGECRLVDGQCGRHSAVNRSFASDYEKWLAATDDKSKCVTPQLKDGNIKIQATSELRVNCREGQCVVQTEGQSNEQ